MEKFDTEEIDLLLDALDQYIVRTPDSTYKETAKRLVKKLEPYETQFKTT